MICVILGYGLPIHWGHSRQYSYTEKCCRTSLSASVSLLITLNTFNKISTGVGTSIRQLVIISVVLDILINRNVMYSVPQQPNAYKY
ncbi:hypothetical protein FKM82_028016 [Ascaphus truei]